MSPSNHRRAEICTRTATGHAVGALTVPLDTARRPGVVGEPIVRTVT